MNSKDFVKKVWDIAYDILDNIVCPIAGIGHPLADIYLASIKDHTQDEKDSEKVIEEIAKKYKLDDDDKIYLSAFTDEPLAVVALFLIDREEEQSNG